MTLNAGRAALLLSLVALAFGGWRLAAPAATDARDGAATAVTGAVQPADDARLAVARANLELQRRTQGTYAGATMPADATLVRASTTTYCVQLGDSAATKHVAGPGAVPASGPC